MIALEALHESTIHLEYDMQDLWECIDENSLDIEHVIEETEHGHDGADDNRAEIEQQRY